MQGRRFFLGQCGSKAHTHTNRYSDFRSHHLVHVKRGVVKCLYDRARCITTDVSQLKREETHLRNVFAVLHNLLTRPYRHAEQKNRMKQLAQRQPLICIPYIIVASVKISGGSAAITTDTHLQVYSRTLPSGRNSKVVYKIHVPCSCGKVYVGETK